MSETIKRVGPAVVISKNGDALFVRFRLNAAPSQDWIRCFREPSSYQTNEAHPSNVRFNVDDTIEFPSKLSQLESNIKWMDKYIDLADVACNARIAKELADKKRKEDLETENIEELKKINESIKGL